MTSLWLDRAASTETPPAVSRADDSAGRRFDEIIVGAGITGLVTALLFARAGRRVAVLEARHLGAVATGNTTAKLSLLHGAQLQKIRARTYPSLVQAYVDANRAGQSWLLDFAENAGVRVERRDAVSYATSVAGLAVVDREYEIARAMGLPVTRSATSGLPFAVSGQITLADQAQFDPMEVLAALAAEFRSLGGVIREGVRLSGARAASPVTVHTTVGDFEADRLILATGMPVLDRGLYFAKLRARRSYAAAFSVPTGTDLPQGMYLSVDPAGAAPSRSLRTAPAGGKAGADAGELLLVGGNGHEVGRHPSPAALADDLADWTTEHFPGATRTHAWSAQDYETPHGVPFVGWLPRGRGRIFFASGYDKWGMSNAVQCALTLAGDLLGETPSWAATLHHRMTLPAAMGVGIGMNAAVAKHYAVGWGRALLRRAPDAAPAEGIGVVGRAGIRPTAVSTVDGVTCRLSGVCPHLGAVLSWNDQELSWDCPAHGSRFGADGALLEGPATRDLTPRLPR